jgi:hypothetical protein
MGLLGRLFGKPGKEALISDSGWLREANLVFRRFMAMTSEDATAMNFFARCEFLNREPMLLLTFDVMPALDATPGFPSARCWSRAGDSGYLVVELVQEEDSTSFRFIDGAERAMVLQFSDGQANRLWFGGAAGTLLEFTMPFSPGFEDRVEEAFSWGFDNELDLSTL